MKSRGKIVEWNDTRGFGFVIEDGKTAKIFAHIKSFENRKRKPTIGDFIYFEIRMDEKNRPQATSIRYQNEKASTSKLTLGHYFTGLFIAFLSLSSLLGFLHIYIVGLYFFISIVTVAIYALDKSAAQKGNWRTPESTLQLLSLCGGWPGAFAAQKILRHKSSKVSFQVVFWVTVILNCAALAWLFTKEGHETLLRVIGLLVG